MAVAEGGGCCGLDNLRTLCTPCHRKETAGLRARLTAKARAAFSAGTVDIRRLLVGRGRSLLSAQQDQEQAPEQGIHETSPVSAPLLDEEGASGALYSDD